MARPTKREIPAEIRRFAERWEAHRRERPRRRRLPEALWAEAVVLAQAHGVHRVARALRLDYYALKRRLPGRRQAGGEGMPELRRGPRAIRRGWAVPRHAPSPAGTPRPAFIEVEAPPFAAGPGPALEVEDGSGAKMTVRLLEAKGRDLVALAKALWPCGRQARARRRRG